MVTSYFWQTSWHLGPLIFKVNFQWPLKRTLAFPFLSIFYLTVILAGDARRCEDQEKPHLPLLSNLVAQLGCILHKLHSVLCSLKHQCASCVAQNMLHSRISVRGILDKKTSCSRHGGLACSICGTQFIKQRVCKWANSLRLHGFVLLTKDSSLNFLNCHLAFHIAIWVRGGEGQKWSM